MKAMCDGRQGGVAVCAACWRTAKGRRGTSQGRVRVGRGPALEADRWIRHACCQPSLSLAWAAGGNKVFNGSQRYTELPAASVGNQ